LGEKLADVAKHRGTEPTGLSRLVRGDLDWIVMKCLEKDRKRRYETANGLAADVARHLDSEPIVACPSSNLYRFRKLVCRNKLAFAALAAIATVLVLGVGACTFWALRATRAEREQSRLRQQAQEAGTVEARLRQRADELTSTTVEQAKQIRHQLYASHMNVAFQCWEKGDLSRVEQLLYEHWPKTGEEDLRGFEWYYLWRLCHSEQLTLRGRDGLMRCVAFSPDGHLLATAAEDSTARIWDAMTGKQLHILSKHTNGVSSAVFSPDAKMLATGSADETVRLWDVATGEELAVLSGHKQGVTALVFDPEGKWLASASGKLGHGGDSDPYGTYLDSTPLQAELKVWNIKDRKVILTMAGHTKSILSLAVSPDGKKLATGSLDSTVKIWQVASGTMESNITPFQGPVIAVAFSQDGKWLAIGGGDPHSVRAELKIWDVAANREQIALKGHEGPVFTLKFAPDSKTLATAGLDQIVRLWGVAGGYELRTLKGHAGSIWSLAWDPNGKRIASASWDQAVKVWDTVQPQGQEVFAGAGGYSGCFTPDGHYLIRGGSQLEVIDMFARKPTFIIPESTVGDATVVISPDGSKLASAGTSGTVTLWEVGTWRRLATLRGHTNEVWGLVFAPNGGLLATCDRENVRLWDVTNGVEHAIVHLQVARRLFRLCFTPDGQTLIASDWLGSKTTGIVFLNPVNGEIQKSVPGRCLALSMDARYMAIDRSGLGLLDLKTMLVKWLTTPHRDKMWSAEFSPDGKTLATASWDGTAKLWNVASGQEMFSYTGQGVVWSVNFSPDGKWWVVGSGSSQRSEVACFRRAMLPEVEAAGSAPIGYEHGQPIRH